MSDTDQIVLDGSLALARCFTDERCAYGDAIAARFLNLDALVPSLWPLEIANAFLMGERRGRSAEPL